MFRTGRYNVMLTAAEFVSLDLLRLYWSKQYAEGEWVGGSACVCSFVRERRWVSRPGGRPLQLQLAPCLHSVFLPPCTPG